jgi:hypothetical protein
MDKVIIADLTLALIGPIRRLHLMVKGGAQHFDMTILGHKLDADKAETQDAFLVTTIISRVLDYAEFIGHDHIGVYAVSNLMGYVESHENRLALTYSKADSYGVGMIAAFSNEMARIQRVKDAIVEGINQPDIFW